MTLRARAIMGLSLLGLADSLYMLAYHEGWIAHLWCPFFGDGCQTVGRSPQARHAGVPNAAVGALGYAAMGVLAAMDAHKVRGERRGEVPPVAQAVSGATAPALALTALSTGAVAASAVLTWEQGRRVRAWCFWCLLSAVLNAGICALAWMNLARKDGPAAAERLRPATLKGGT